MGLTRKEAESLGLGDLYPDDPPRTRGPSYERGVMNRTEARFAVALEGRRILGEISGWAFEEDTLRLSADMVYTPDFRVEQPDGWIEYVDVKRLKGWTHEDSIVKGKAAAVIFPFHRFFLAYWVDHRMRSNGRFVAAHWHFRRLGIPRRNGKAS